VSVDVHVLSMVISRGLALVLYRSGWGAGSCGCCYGREGGKKYRGGLLLAYLTSAGSMARSRDRLVVGLSRWLGTGSGGGGGDALLL